MSWTQKGRIYVPDGSREWSRSHAQVPSALLLDERIRIYYATRDAQGRSLTSFIDVDAHDPTRVLYDHPHPVMGLGEPGTHDEDGVMTSCALRQGDEVWLYYTGWSRGGNVPYRVSCGLAISTDGGYSFKRAFDGPVVDRTRFEPHMTMSPCVLHTGKQWQMWYGSGLSWVEVAGKMEPIYVIKYATSADGKCWQQPDQLCIAQQHPLEANTRPAVLATNDGYEMWFSYRHSRDFRDGAGGYRIGRALSLNGVDWQRQDDPPDLQPGLQDWSSHMMAYPSIIRVNGQAIMFHNGDGFGRAGFGYSVFNT
ncbi:MAG: hypothetical protein QM776_02475 [Rhodocyclaceae bacterium]